MFNSFLVATLWASTGIFIKFIDGLSIPSIILGRFFIAFIFSLIFVRGVTLKPAFSYKSHSYTETILSLMMTSYYVFATYSFSYAPVAMAALLISLSPLFTFLFILVLQGEFNENELIGFLVAFIGLIVYFYGKDYIASGYQIWHIILGGFFAVLAAILRAVFSYIVWVKNENNTPIDANYVNRRTLIYGVILLIIPAYQTQNYIHIEWMDIIFLLGLGLVATYIPNTLNTLSSMRVNPTVHNIIGMSTPISASIMSWFWLRESQSVISVGAMIITVAGIFWSMRPGKEKTIKIRRDTVKK